MDNKDFEYFETRNLGKGLPFAYVAYKNIIERNDILQPSLRDFHVIFLIKQGTGSYVVDFKEYEFKPGTIILISKDQLHYFLPFDLEQTEINSISFRPDFIYKTGADLHHLAAFQPVRHIHGEQILIPHKKLEAKLAYLESELATLYESPESKAQSKAFYHHLCIYLMHCEQLQENQDIAPSALEPDHMLVQQFIDLVEVHFRKESKLEFYADSLNITTRKLSKLIQKHFKQSAKSYIDERRVLELKRQISGTSKSGKELAYELGFDEPTNMYKFFKKHVGITTSEFRESHT